jgi:hypothetical protein
MKLKKCTIMLPTLYNNGKEVPAEVLSGILKDIDMTFDGHRVDGKCEGSDKMDDGALSCDTSVKVCGAVDPQRMEEVKNMAARYAKILKQDRLHFEITEAEIESIRPSHVGDVL